MPRAGLAPWACVSHSSFVAVSNSSALASQVTASAACARRESWAAKLPCAHAEQSFRGMGSGSARRLQSRVVFSAKVVGLVLTVLGARLQAPAWRPKPSSRLVLPTAT